MGTLNKKEKELLSEIVESIEEELGIISHGYINNDRLAYLTCLNEDEKVEYTKSEIRKLQEGFKGCKPDISEDIFGLIQKHPFDNSTQDEKQTAIIEGFILLHYSEAFELLMKPSNNKSLYEKSFRECIEGLKFETGLLDEFICNVANANRYLGLVSLLNDIILPPIKNDTEIQLEGQMIKVEEKIVELIRWLFHNMKGEVETLLTPIPLLLIDKKVRDHVIDSYRWQEKKIFESNIQTCKGILNLSSKHEQVNTRINNLRNEIELCLNTYENKLREYNNKYQYPKTDFKGITSQINDAFFRLESFTNGKLKEYKYFGFYDAFYILFNEVLKPENYTYKNCKLMIQYRELTAQICSDYESGDFENDDANDNEIFCKDCEEIWALLIDEDFEQFITDELAEYEKKFSITDIYKPSHDHPIINQPENPIPQPNENPYPRIFKDHNSFLFFESLKNDVRERFLLADYSFIYRRMQKDGYIYKTVLDSEFRDFLHDNYSIDIDKTKLLAYCKTDHKENLYGTKKRPFPHL